MKSDYRYSLNCPHKLVSIYLKCTRFVFKNGLYKVISSHSNVITTSYNAFFDIC